MCPLPPPPVSLERDRDMQAWRSEGCAPQVSPEDSLCFWKPDLGCIVQGAALLTLISSWLSEIVRKNPSNVMLLAIYHIEL